MTSATEKLRCMLDERGVQYFTDDDEKPTVRNMWSIGIEGSVGFVVGKEVYEEIRDAVLSVLSNHEDELIVYSWTLNRTYREDGRQVCISYPKSEEWIFCDKERRLKRAKTAMGFSLHRCLYTDEEDREKVGELCGMVARGELEVGE